MFAVIIHCGDACLQVKIDTVEKFKASMGAFHTRAAAEATKLKACPSSIQSMAMSSHVPPRPHVFSYGPSITFIT